MFNNTPPGGAGKESAVQQSIRGLGTAAGITGAVFLAPHAYRAFKAPMLGYMTELYGETFGDPMTWLVGAVAAFAIYFGIKLAFTSGLTWLWMAIGKRSV